MKRKMILILFCVSATMIAFYFLPFSVSRSAQAQAAQKAGKNDPLVIVVHGIGGGNREQGWSNQIVDKWGIPRSYVEEINFQYKGRTSGKSLTDFSRMGWQWGNYVRKELDRLVKENPGRPIVLVTHSWGTVATTMALNGANTNEGEVPPLRLKKGRISQFITLGSPLGRAVKDEAGSLVQLGIDLYIHKPDSVKHWTNIADRKDPVAKVMQKLPHADENILVGGSAGFLETVYTRGVAAHTGVWTQEQVRDFMKLTVWGETQGGLHRDDAQEEIKKVWKGTKYHIRTSFDSGVDIDGVLAKYKEEEKAPQEDSDTLSSQELLSEIGGVLETSKTPPKEIAEAPQQKLTNAELLAQVQETLKQNDIAEQEARKKQLAEEIKALQEKMKTDTEKFDQEFKKLTAEIEENIEHSDEFLKKAEEDLRRKRRARQKLEAPPQQTRQKAPAPQKAVVPQPVKPPPSTKGNGLWLAGDKWGGDIYMDGRVQASFQITFYQKSGKLAARYVQYSQEAGTKKYHIYSVQADRAKGTIKITRDMWPKDNTFYKHSPKYSLSYYGKFVNPKRVEGEVVGALKKTKFIMVRYNE